MTIVKLAKVSTLLNTANNFEKTGAAAFLEYIRETCPAITDDTTVCIHSTAGPGLKRLDRLYHAPIGPFPELGLDFYWSFDQQADELHFVAYAWGGYERIPLDFDAGGRGFN